MVFLLVVPSLPPQDKHNICVQHKPDGMAAAWRLVTDIWKRQQYDLDSSGRD